jgi:hypothetical protein
MLVRKRISECRENTRLFVGKALQGNEVILPHGGLGMYCPQVAKTDHYYLIFGSCKPVLIPYLPSGVEIRLLMSRRLA